jgi:hypothetical protein
MEKDKKRDAEPITERLSPQDDPSTIAATELFVSDSEKQKSMENATEGYEPKAQHKGSNPMIDHCGYCKINKGAQGKEDISIKLEMFAHRVLSSNANGLLRQYLPKGASMAGLSQHQCNAIARKLNTRPRKRLGFKTPLECYNEAWSVLHPKLDVWPLTF